MLWVASTAPLSARTGGDENRCTSSTSKLLYGGACASSVQGCRHSISADADCPAFTSGIVCELEAGRLHLVELVQPTLDAHARTGLKECCTGQRNQRWFAATVGKPYARMICHNATTSQNNDSWRRGPTVYISEAGTKTHHFVAVLRRRDAVGDAIRSCQRAACRRVRSLACIMQVRLCEIPQPCTADGMLDCILGPVRQQASSPLCINRA